MEAAPPKATRNSSNVLLRFSELCKLRSVGVSPPVKNPKANSTQETSDDTRDQKIYPQPLDVTVSTSVECSQEAALMRLFEAISSLKLAYVQLQQAHIPYEPDKIKVANELVVAELEALSELEDLFSKKQQCKPMCQSSIGVLIQEHQKTLVGLQSELQSKESDILRMRSELEELNRKNLELEGKIKRKALSGDEPLLLRRELTADVFSEVFKLASMSIHEFAKPLIGLMRASGWDLDQVVSLIDNTVVYYERSHKKYAFEAYLSRIMLMGAQDGSLTIDDFDCVMSFRDPFDALLKDPDSNFGRFCRSKYVVAVPSKMEESFFGNLDQRAFLMAGGHPRTPFYQAFVRMARLVWALQVMANSFIPRAEIFYVKRGNKYKKDYMESVVAEVVPKEGDKITVGFTVTPGFKIGATIVHCRVYLSKMVASIRNSEYKI
ncbi:protein GRAVITROPIC IN THE LIGHT 1-like [Typha latifolia]|uniref:protein GRAVITROPIC IN THE LIGHT 1-like n=1 Tax=Typha latifolia TaxID=4733 RepID=UPI003C2EEB28